MGPCLLTGQQKTYIYMVDVEMDTKQRWKENKWRFSTDVKMESWVSRKVLVSWTLFGKQEKNYSERQSEFSSHSSKFQTSVKYLNGSLGFHSAISLSSIHCIHKQLSVILKEFKFICLFTPLLLSPSLGFFLTVTFPSERLIRLLFELKNSSEASYCLYLHFSRSSS